MSPHLLSRSGDSAKFEPCLVFQVGRWSLALLLDQVLKVLPVMEAIPLPGAPRSIAGVIRLDRIPIPVVDMRVVLGSMLKEVETTDVLILASTPVRQVALWVDEVKGMMSFSPDDLAEAEPLLGENRLIRRISSQSDGLIFIFNLETMLTPEGEAALADALQSMKEQV